METAIAAGRGNPEGSLAPLDAFRAEINAAYNAVVMRCKTHMHCLEAHGYDEAKCYMAATARKDAERRFADLAEDLRLIETRKKAAALRRPPSVTVTTTNNIDQDVDQNQSNESQTGNRIEDQDILQVCGDARNLLSARCRKPCPKC